MRPCTSSMKRVTAKASRWSSRYGVLLMTILLRPVVEFPGRAVRQSQLFLKWEGEVTDRHADQGDQRCCGDVWAAERRPAPGFLPNPGSLGLADQYSHF